MKKNNFIFNDLNYEQYEKLINYAGKNSNIEITDFGKREFFQEIFKGVPLENEIYNNVCIKLRIQNDFNPRDLSKIFLELNEIISSSEKRFVRIDNQITKVPEDYEIGLN